MEYAFLDIETVPIKIENEEVKSYLMDKKITAGRRSLDPNYSKIIVIGIKVNDNLELLYDEDEKALLEKFWKFVENKDLKFITHNGYGFDIPFLIVRSCLNNVKITNNINKNKWNMEKSNHFDTMLFFSQNIFTNPNLHVLAHLQGIEFKDNKIRGNDVERLYGEGKIDEIKEHCKLDIEILEKVFRKSCLSYLESLG